MTYFSHIMLILGCCGWTHIFFVYIRRVSKNAKKSVKLDNEKKKYCLLGRCGVVYALFWWGFLRFCFLNRVRQFFKKYWGVVGWCMLCFDGVSVLLFKLSYLFLGWSWWVVLVGWVGMLWKIAYYICCSWFIFMYV